MTMPGLLGCWVAGLLGCWVAGLLGWGAPGVVVPYSDLNRWAHSALRGSANINESKRIQQGRARPRGQLSPA